MPNSPIKVVGGSIDFGQSISGQQWIRPCYSGGPIGYGGCYSVAANLSKYVITLQNEVAAGSPYDAGAGPWEVNFEVQPSGGQLRGAASICSNLDPTSHKCTMSAAAASGNVYVVPATANDGFSGNADQISYENQGCTAGPSCTMIATVQVKTSRVTYGPVPCSDGTPGGNGNCNVGIDSK